jgi:hypothetical protein
MLLIKSHQRYLAARSSKPMMTCTLHCLCHPSPQSVKKGRTDLTRKRLEKLVKDNNKIVLPKWRDEWFIHVQVENFLAWSLQLCPPLLLCRQSIATNIMSWQWVILTTLIMELKNIYKKNLKNRIFFINVFFYF